ncbi:MAG: Na+/H+ antiporter subunit E [Quadrisphaera sp.]
MAGGGACPTAASCPSSCGWSSSGAACGARSARWWWWAACSSPWPSWRCSRCPPCPPAPLPSLVGSVRLALFVVYDLLRSSLQVAWFAVRPGPVPASAIVAAPLRSRSDAMIAATAELLSLVPGTLVVDIDVPSGTLYLHALVTGDPERVGDDVREQVRRMEERVLAALAPGALRDGTDVADDVREAQR